MGIERKKMEVLLIQSTPNAERILSFAKNTRLLGDGNADIWSNSMENVMKNVEYSMNTIRGPLEFVHYIFLFLNASRAMTHQLVRHRVASFAQQSLRVSDNFGYYQPPVIDKNEEARELYQLHVLNSGNIYGQLVELGIDMQDARGVLPIHVTSAIMMKINLRALLEMFETRLCLRVQGEHRQANISMANEVRKIHPWLENHIGPLCSTKGICAFPRYDCPVSKAHPFLKGPSAEQKQSVNQHLKSFGSKGLSVGTQKESKSGLPECFGQWVGIINKPECISCPVSGDCMLETHQNDIRKNKYESRSESRRNRFSS